MQSDLQKMMRIELYRSRVENKQDIWTGRELTSSDSAMTKNCQDCQKEFEARNCYVIYCAICKAFRQAEQARRYRLMKNVLVG